MARGLPPDSHSAIRRRMAGTRTLRALVRRTERLLNGLSPSAPRVSGPTMPSGTRSWLRWKRFTARSVCAPKTPSAVIAELLLDAPNGRAAVAALHDDLAGGAGAAGGRGAGVRERGHRRDDHYGHHEQAREMRATHGVEDPCHLTFPLSSAYGVS